LDQTNKRLFTVAGFNPEHFLVSIFPASEKFDSNLELDAGMHKTDAHPKPMVMGMDIQCRALQNTISSVMLRVLYKTVSTQLLPEYNTLEG
jgi:hypothetical protein